MKTETLEALRAKSRELTAALPILSVDGGGRFYIAGNPVSETAVLEYMHIARGLAFEIDALIHAIPERKRPEKANG